MSPVHGGVLAALKLFGSLPGCALATTRDGSLLYASGTPEAGENYLGLGESGGTRETVDAARAFFSARTLPFACPLFGSASPETRHALEALETSKQASRTWMTCMHFTYDEQKITPFIPTESQTFAFSRLQGEPQAHAWADAAWGGFGDDTGSSATFEAAARSPETFRAFAAACAAHPDIALYGVTENTTRQICATLLAARTPFGTAIFYVATRSEWRHRGLATRLLGKALADADDALPKVFLLATDAGEPMYRKFGFTDEGTEGRIPVYLIRP